MSDKKVIAASIVNYLKQQSNSDSLKSDAWESLEVGIQCIETAFELGPEDAGKAPDLESLFKQQKGTTFNEQAESLKNEGNDLMKADKCREALEKYNRAIELDPKNAVYFCNRAAAHFKLGQHDSAIADCKKALAIDPNYSKAYGRLGLAYAALERHREAHAAYAKATELEPTNETYQQNLRVSEQQLAQGGGASEIDLGAALQNPELMNMATQMLGNPSMQTLIQGLMNSNLAGPISEQGPGFGSFLEISQNLARQMQAANPDLVEQLRRQMGPPGPGNGNPPPTNQ